MTYTTLDWLLSLLPILVIVGLMVGRNWNTNRAGLAGWLLAIGLAAWRFRAGSDGVLAAQLKALVLTADVVIVIGGALLLYAIVDRAGALAVMTDALSGLTADRLIQVLLLGWVFASFLQGVGGFGVPVAIVAPLLIGLGVPEMRAVVIPSLGHGWAVTFGSLAAAFIVLVNVTGLPGDDLAAPAALMLGILCYISGLMCAHAFDGWHGVRRSLPYVLITGTAMSAAQFLTAIGGLWTLAAVMGGLAGLVASVLWIRWQGAPGVPTMTTVSTPRPSIGRAFSSYAILIILALALRGITPIKDFLGQWALAVDIPATITGRGWTVAREPDAGFAIPAHPGVVILYSCLIAYGLFRRYYAPGAARAILRDSGQRTLKTGIGVFMMVGMAATMERAGMMEIVADGLSQSVPGGLYAFVAPLIGALGAFVTGSNINSNAVFGLLQLNTARLLDLSIYPILAAQTSAAAVISMVSPAKVAVGCSTVGAPEGVVLRWLLGYGALVVLIVGGLTWLGLVLFA